MCFFFKILHMIFIATCVSGELKLTILHTNDIHSRIGQTSISSTRCSKKDASDNNCYGGVARIKTEVDKLRSENENVLLLDAGDVFQGTTWFIVYNGSEAAYFMNKLKYDVMVSTPDRAKNVICFYNSSRMYVSIIEGRIIEGV